MENQRFLKVVVGCHSYRVVRSQLELERCHRGALVRCGVPSGRAVAEGILEGVIYDRSIHAMTVGRVTPRIGGMRRAVDGRLPGNNRRTRILPRSA